MFYYKIGNEIFEWKCMRVEYRILRIIKSNFIVINWLREYIIKVDGNIVSFFFGVVWLLY